MSVASRAIRTTSKGLITERHGLIFDPDATVDELNCEVLVNQVRKRRKGVSYEVNHQLSSFSHNQGDIVSEKTWENVGGSSSLQFLVVQNGDMLYFYDKSADTISSSLKSFSIDLNDFSVGNSKSLEGNAFQGDSLDGIFVVSHPGCDLFYIEYDIDTDTISTESISPKTRDFDWQIPDITVYFEISPGSEVTNFRKYDSRNAGWDDDAIDASVKPLATYIATYNRHPALTKPWYSGKASNDLFSVVEWDKVWSGNSLSGNGHYILDFFSKNREQYVTGMGVETERSRFSTVAAFAGRFWYAGLESDKNSGKILFTRVIRNNVDYEFCYQENDPTAETISDLLDTDGGEINIPEAYGIKKLWSFGPNLIVFAENGVWQINGVDNVFKATEYSVSKITNFGLFNPDTFVDAGGVPFWWSPVGIHTLSVNDVSGISQDQNITRQTIQTFWDDIDGDKKLQAKGIFNEKEQKVYWMYPSNSESIDFKYNNFLILDLVNQSFVPWTVSDQASNTNYILGAAYFPTFRSTPIVQNVTVNGVQVTVNTVDVTIESGNRPEGFVGLLKLIVRDGATGNVTFAEFSNILFLDWEDTNYSSYFQLGYDDYDSLSVEKVPISVYTYFNRTEDGWSDNGDDTYSPTNQSSCLMEAFWDFSSTSSTAVQQVYRLKNFLFVDENDLSTFTYPTSVVINRTTLKGSGRVLSLKFSSEQGKDFQFLSYELVFDRHDQL